MKNYIELKGFDEQNQWQKPEWLARLVRPGEGVCNFVLLAKIFPKSRTERRTVARTVARYLYSGLRGRDRLMRSDSTFLVVLQAMREEEAIRSELAVLFELGEQALSDGHEELSMHGGGALARDDKAVVTTLRQAHGALNYARADNEPYELYRSFMTRSVRVNNRTINT